MFQGLRCVSFLFLGQALGSPHLPFPFTPAEFREHVAYLASDELEGREVASAGSAKAMEYIIRHLKIAQVKGLGAEGSWSQEFPLGDKEKKVSARNVLGVFPGKGSLAAEAIIVSAHHDHLGIRPKLIKEGKDGIYNGADDNASGCAALLLVAKALAADRERLPASCRTVIFASFDAEEHGLLGSRYYVRHPLWPLEKTTANINFDMVGRLFGGKVLAADSASSAFLTERTQALAKECGLAVETRLHGAGRADSATFLDQAIPAVHFNSGLHSDYHQVTDEVSKIDSEGGARISWLAYRLLREMVENPERLRFRRPPPNFDVQAILRIVFRLGIIPEQNSQGGRYPLIRLVIPNSLAAKQGLRAGDEIVSLNGKKFENIFDAAVSFGSLRLDRDVALTINRKGETKDFKISAEALKDFAGPARKDVGERQYEVTFRYKPAKQVDSVTLAGTFNNWDAKSLKMDGPDKEGAYSTTRTMTRGVYEYKFVIDGSQWLADPTNLRTTATTGNSLLILGED